MRLVALLPFPARPPPERDRESLNDFGFLPTSRVPIPVGQAGQLARALSNALVLANSRLGGAGFPARECSTGLGREFRRDIFKV